LKHGSIGIGVEKLNNFDPI